MKYEWSGITLDTMEHIKISYVYRKVLEKATIPPLHFKPEWDVRIIPPFGGAMMRFIVNHNSKQISVYCDFFDELGYYGEPYWEMYPRSHRDGKDAYLDVMRFPLADTEGLIRNIDEELNGIAAGEEGGAQ